jgi:hypothetical protein
LRFKEIDCSEDDGEALLILLKIAYLNFKAAPKKVSYDIPFLLLACSTNINAFGLFRLGQSTG